MDRMALLQALREHPLLARIHDLHLKAIGAAGEVEMFGAQEMIVEEGALGDAIFLILSGRAVVNKRGTGGRKLAELGPGEFFGEMCLVEPAQRSASVIAVEPTVVFRLPNQAVHQLAERDPRAMNALLAAVIRTIGGRLRRMNEMVSQVGQLSDWLKGSLV